jgi:hypothetical protein
MFITDRVFFFSIKCYAAPICTRTGSKSLDPINKKHTKQNRQLLISQPHNHSACLYIPTYLFIRIKISRYGFTFNRMLFSNWQFRTRGPQRFKMDTTEFIVVVATCYPYLHFTLISFYFIVIIINYYYRPCRGRGLSLLYHHTCTLNESTIIRKLL